MRMRELLSSTFWTASHFTGVVLILGALLFGIGGGLYTPIKDEKGSLSCALDFNTNEH
jgi:hypothetical protein